MAIANHLQLVLKQLKANNFIAYINILRALGAEVSAEVGVFSVKELGQQTILPHIPLNIDLAHLDTLYTQSEWQTLHLQAALFAKLWGQENNENFLLLAGDPAQYKTKFTTHSRHLIHLGLLAVESIIQTHCHQPLTHAELQETTVQESVTAMDKAFINYQSKKQKLSNWFAQSLAIISSLAFGVVQTGVAFFFVSLMLFSPGSWMALGCLIGALLLGSIFSYISYCTLKHDVPAILSEIIGKDKFLQGFREYKDSKGNTKAFNRKQLFALSIFSFFFALPSAIATGAFGFTSTLSIAGIFTSFGIAVPAVIFPPLGVAFAIIITLTMALFAIKSFHAFIAHHNGNPISFVRKPFSQINTILNAKIPPTQHPTLNKFARISAFALSGILCAMALVGLTVSAIGGVNSVTALSSKVFQAPIFISNIIGIIIGGVMTFSSKFFFTLGKCGDLMVNLIKIACRETVGRIDKFGLIAGLFVDLPLAALSWFDALTRPPVNRPVVPMPSSKTAAGLVTACTSVKDLGLVVNSMFIKKNSLEVIKVKSNDDFTKQGKIAKEFVKKPANLKHYNLFADYKNDSTQPSLPQPKIKNRR